MAHFPKGLMGAFSGRIGNLVGSTWNGIAYMRSLPDLKRKPKVSPAQQAQRAKFRIAMKFVHSMHELFMMTFKDKASGKTGINNALAYTMMHAMKGSFPDMEIDYPRLLISKGTLPNASNVSVEMDNANNLLFRWEDNSSIPKATRGDNTILLAYDPINMYGIYRTGTANRSDTEAVLSLDRPYGKEFHVYFGMMSANGKLVADSVYLGKFTAVS